MHKAIIFVVTFFFLAPTVVLAQSTEYIFSPEDTGALSDPFPVDEHNGARGLSGPWDLDQDGNLEVLVAQHDASGGRVHVIENQGVDSWALVYSTAFIDSSSSSNNARYATAGDLDGDGNWEILYVAGTSYSASNADNAGLGVYVWEHDGTVGSDNYGTRPASVGNFYDLDDALTGLDPATFVYAQNLEVADVDGDGQQEVLLPANGPSSHDVFYVLSVNGDFETNGAGTTFEAWNVESRIGPREDGNAFGGGSPNDIIAADLDGDGNLDISFHSWNNFVLFNGTATGTDAYLLPDAGAANRFINDFRPGEDDVSLFGGLAVDIDGDGNDEVFYPNWFTKNIGVLDYDDDDDVLGISEEVFAFDAIPIRAAGGIATGDADGDGFPELYVGGNGYSAEDYAAGEGSYFIHVAEYLGGDPKDPSNWFVDSLDTSSPLDTVGFNVVYRDSAGVITRYYETALAKQGSLESADDPTFTTGIAYLGDADGDGNVEIALSFQGVDDSLLVYDELYVPDSLTSVFNTPVDSTNPGPIGPGEAYEFTVDAAPGSRLSFATMFIQSNDLFYAPADSGLALYNEDGTQRSGDVTSEITLWDAGSEENQEPGAGSNQPANQSAPDTGPDDPDATVREVNDSFTYPAVSDVIQVTLTPAEDSDTGFTVRIENVSTETTLGGSSSVSLAPGVWVVHQSGRPLFTDGEVDMGDGLEALAEDGDPAPLAEALDAELSFFRTERERIAAPARPFVRIISLDGISVAVEEAEIPTGYSLSPNFPNPFNPTTTFQFSLPADRAVSVKVYDVMGRLVRTLIDNQMYTQGTHNVTWNARNDAGSSVASGMYFYTLEYGPARLTRPMVLIK